MDRRIEETARLLLPIPGDACSRPARNLCTLAAMPLHVSSAGPGGGVPECPIHQLLLSDVLLGLTQGSVPIPIYFADAR
jgi:hypothetical protein